MVDMTEYKAYRAKYEPWREQIADYRFIHPDRLGALFDQGLSPAEVETHCRANGWYEIPRGPGRPPVCLDLQSVKRRIANAVYKECSHLMVRNLDDEARRFVAATMESSAPK